MQDLDHYMNSSFFVRYPLKKGSMSGFCSLCDAQNLLNLWLMKYHGTFLFLCLFTHVKETLENHTNFQFIGNIPFIIEEVSNTSVKLSLMSCQDQYANYRRIGH